MKTKMLFYVLFVTSTCLFSTIINVPVDIPTIQAGIDNATENDTVLVADGTYYENIDFIGKAITVASNFIIDGDEAHIENTIINGSQSANPDYGSCVRFMSGEDTFSVITGFTMTGGTGTYYEGWGTIGGGICIDSSSPTITNNVVKENSADYDGALGCSYNGSAPKIMNNVFTDNIGVIEIGGLDFYQECNPYLEGNIIKNNFSGDSHPEGIGGINFKNSTGILRNNVIIDNQSESGIGGICIWTNSSVEIINCIISGNIAEEKSGGIYIISSEVSIINCTISGNTSGDTGSAIYTAASDITMINTIVEGNEAIDGAAIYFYQPVNVDIQFCDFYNNQINFEGDVPAELGEILYVNANGDSCDAFMNIFEDPLFTGNFEDPFSLAFISPCIDCGIPDVTGLNVQGFDIIGNLRIWDGDGNGTAIIDMGVYEFGAPPYVDIEDNVIVQTPEVLLHQNYPNPFNPETTIEYSIVENSNVDLSIYNIKGQKVKTFSIAPRPSTTLRTVSGDQRMTQAGSNQYSVTWNGKDENNKPVSSGIYFYKLKAGNFEKTKKMILMK